MWKDCLVMEQGSLCVEADYLASGTESRIDSHDTFLSQRRSQKQLAEVAGKDPDSLFIGLVFA